MRSQALLPLNLHQCDRHHDHQPYRHHYSPRADRLPRWLHRVWAWF